MTLRTPFLLAGCLVAAAGAATAQNRAETTEVETIIVTAQKRSENLQDAPLSVQALTASALEAAGASGTQDLETLVPGLTFGNNLNAGTPYLRGVGQNTGVLGVESPVAVYVDGVYLVAPSAGLFSFNNIEQIEVAKGPQGTLFGRNTTGGVIQVITKAPSHQPQLKASVGYGAYDTVSGDLYATGALAPELAGSLAFYGLKRSDGFIDNLFLGRKVGQRESWGLQGKLRWTPSDATDATLSASYNWERDYQGTTNGVYPGMVADDRITRYAGNYKVFDAIPTPNRDAQALGALTVNHDLGFGSLTSISGYHRLWGRYNFVQNAQPIHTPLIPGVAALTPYGASRQETFTQELQIKSPDGADLRWIAGLYYLRDKTQQDTKDFKEGRFIFHVQAPNLIAGRQITESYAAFAEASKTILPDTRLTLGIRYSRDEKRSYGTALSLLANGSLLTTSPQAPGPGQPPLDTPKSWDDFTFRAVLDHHFTPDVMGYVSFNRGFKSGLFNINTFTNPPVDPETVNAYEVGLKSELFERRLRLNVAGFYYDYRDVQLRQTGGAFPGRFVLLNAASAEVKGIDVDVTAVPVRNLTVTGGFEILDANYKSFPGAPFALPNPVTLPLPAGCRLLGASLPASAAFLGGNTTVTCDASGFRMIRSPKFTGNLGATYLRDLAGGASLRFNVNDHYNSGFFWDVDHLLRQKAYHDVAASLTWTAPAGDWDVTLWGSNLAQAHIWVTATAGSTSTYAPGEPRMFGVRLSVRR